MISCDRAAIDFPGAERDFEPRGFLGEERVYKWRKTLKRSENTKTQKVQSLQAPVSGGKVANVREDLT